MQVIVHEHIYENLSRKSDQSDKRELKRTLKHLVFTR